MGERHSRREISLSIDAPGSYSVHTGSQEQNNAGASGQRSPGSRIMIAWAEDRAWGVRPSGQRAPERRAGMIAEDCRWMEKRLTVSQSCSVARDRGADYSVCWG